MMTPYTFRVMQCFILILRVIYPYPDSVYCAALTSVIRVGEVVESGDGAPGDREPGSHVGALFL